MLEAVYIWVSLAFMFLLASIWGEADTRFGIVLVPLFVCIFWLFGWLPTMFMNGALMFAIVFGIMTFLKDHYRKNLAQGTLGGFTIWKIMAFLIFLQFSIVLVCGLTYSFGETGSKMSMPVNTTSTKQYNLVTAQTAYGNMTQVNQIDYVTTGLQLGWVAFNALFSMWFGLVLIIPTLIEVFHVPPDIAGVVGIGIYLMIAVEVFTLIVFRTRPPTV